jgi:hypothetical protein
VEEAENVNVADVTVLANVHVAKTYVALSTKQKEKRRLENDKIDKIQNSK